MVWIPYGPQWRLLRKICTTELFSTKRMDALQHLRRQEVHRIIGSIFEDSKEARTVNVGASAFVTSLSLVGRMVCGKLVFLPGSQEAAEFKDMVWQLLKLAGVINLSDVFPFFERFDLQGLNRKMKSLAMRFDSLFDRIIEERLQDRAAGVHDSCGEGKDFLEAMLDLKNDGTQFTLEDIKGLVMVSGLNLHFSLRDTKL